MYAGTHFASNKTLYDKLCLVQKLIRPFTSRYEGDCNTYIHKQNTGEDVQSITLKVWEDMMGKTKKWHRY